MVHTPSPLAELPADRLAGVRGLCFDIDDTFTTHGRIHPEAYSALWAAHDAGLALVPVTGRPAGWCDHLCRMWPVAGVVGENGAFWFAHDPVARRVERRWARGEAERAADRLRLEAVRDEVLATVPGARVAADQAFRAVDLAIDFAEDTGPLDPEAVDRIAGIFRRHGATAKISSIHVNGWFGDHDKRGMLQRFAAERLGLSQEEARRTLVYVGDSPNDEPLFEAFDLSVGVANVARFLPRMVAPPRWITRAEAGAGFAEVVAAILAARQPTGR